MKKLDFGQTLHLLGNVGVVIGIFLLVYELNQNREMMQAQTRNEISQAVATMLFEITSDREYANINFRGDKGEELTELESYQYLGSMLAQFRLNENVHYQYRNGLYDEFEFAAQKNTWRVRFADKGIAKLWCAVQAGFSPEFAAEINGLLTTYKCE